MWIIIAKMENKMADAKKAGTDVVVTGMIICRNQRPFFWESPSWGLQYWVLYEGDALPETSA